MARVLVVTVAHPPEDARIRHREIAALSEHGHRVTYAAPFRAFRTAPPTTLRCLDVPRSAGQPLRRLPALLAAARLMWRESARHDAVLVHDPELLPALALLRLRRRRPVLVWDVHEDVPAQMYMLKLPRAVQRLGARVLTGLERAAERHVRLLLAETAYQDRFSLPHPVVPNSVRVPDTPVVPAESAPRVVYLGALTMARGAGELIAVAERLPHVTIEVLGNAKGDVETRMQAAAARLDNLHYRGFVPNSEALSRLPGALAGLSLLHEHANYAHSQPTKIMEYMAHGVPTITTPNAASRSMVEGADAGVVVGFGEVDGVVAAIRRLDADREEQARLGTNARVAASARYNWGQDGARFAATVQGWVDEASGRG